MSTYKLTAADRRVLAQLQAKKASKPVYTRAAAARAAANSQTSGKKNEDKYKNANPLLKTFATLYDVQKNVSKGAFKSVEGLVDLIAAGVGTVGGIFSEEFRDNVQGFIEEDWAEKYYSSGAYETFIPGLVDLDKYSYTNHGEAGQTVEQVAQGVGQMLPTVAIAIATGGTSLGANAASTAGTAAASTGAKAALSTAGKWAAKNAGTIALGASAAGTGMEEAYQDGASYGEGALYGLASGATEIATEKLLPGPADSFIGKPLFSVGKEIGDQGVKRIIKQTAANAVNEGFEEIVSEASNPLRKSIYKGRDAFEEYGDEEFWKGVGEAGKVGALTSVAFGATVGNMTKGKGYNGDIQASVESITEVSEKRDARNAEKALTKEERAEYSKSIEANEKQIEAVLKKATPEKRAEYIERYKLSGAFNEDGSLKPSRVSETEYNTEYYTPDLDGSEDLIKEDIDILNATDGTNADVFNGELSENGKKHYTKLKKMLNSLNKRSGNHISLTVVDKNAKYEGVTVKDKHGQRIYIRSDVLESGDFSNTSIHEYGHSVEGTKAHTTLTELLKGDESLKTRAEDKFFAAEDDYGVTRDEINKILKKQESKEALTFEEKMKYEEFTSERGANLIAGELGTEEFIDKIVRLDENAARKLVGKIKDMKAAIKSLESKESREKYLRLRRAEKLFLQAAEQSGNVDLARYIQSDLEDDEEDVDKEKEVRYNKNSDLDTNQVLNEERYEAFGWARNAEAITFNELNDLRSKIYEKGSLKKFKQSAKGEAIIEVNNKPSTTLDVDNVFVFVKGDKNSPIITKVIRCSIFNENDMEGVRKYIYGASKRYINDRALSLACYTLGSASAIPYFRENYESYNQYIEQIRGSESRDESERNQDNVRERQERTGDVRQDQKRQIKYSYAGKNSDTADHSLLAEAEELEAQGATSEEIRQQTGWFKSYDGKRRYEIDDSKMVFLGAEVGKETTLGKVIKHDELFEAYPQLKKVKFIADSSMKGKADYDPESDLIRYPAALVSGKNLDKEWSKILIHEIQHAIQEIEGFAQGTNVSYWYNDPELRKEWDKIAERFEAEKREIEEMYGKEALEASIKHYELLKKQKEINESIFDITKMTTITYDKAVAERDAIDEEVYASEDMLVDKGYYWAFIEYQDVAAKRQNDLNAYYDKAEEMYKNTAGEIDAYDVGDRVDFTPEQRKNTRPDVDKDGVLFADDSHLQAVREGEAENSKIKYPQFTDVDIQKNKDKLADIEPVSSISEDKLQRTGKSPKQLFGEFFESLNNHIYSDVFGEIALENSSVKSEIRHGITAEKIASIEAIPSVIEKGKVIFAKTKKKSDVERIVVAAPIRIGVTEYYMGVMLQRDTQNQRLYLHNVLAIKTEETIASSQDNSLTNWSGEDDSRLFITSILQDAINVKLNKQKKKINYSRKSDKAYESETDLPLGAIARGDRLLKSLEQRSESTTQNEKQTSGYVFARPNKKIYSHTDAYNIAEDISSLLVFDEHYGEISRNKLIEHLLQVMNATGRNERDAANAIADYVITNATLGNIYELEDVSPYVEVLDTLKPYLHSLDISAYSSEIVHKYGKKNSLHLLWGKKNSGVTPDMIVSELRNAGIIIEAENPIDILFEIHDLYIEARDKLRKKAKQHFETVLSSDEREQVKKDITAVVLKGYKEMGSFSELEKLKLEHREKINKIKERQAQEVKDLLLRFSETRDEVRELKKTHNEELERLDNEHREKIKALRDKKNAQFKEMQLELTEKVRDLRYKVSSNDIKNNIIKSVQWFKDFKADTFLNASQYENHIFKASLEKIRSITRANFSETLARKVFADLKIWYTKENPLIYDKALSDDEQIYQERVAEMLDYICKGEGDFNITQLRYISSVLGHFKSIMQNYGKAYIDGKWIEIAPLAKKFVDIIKENEKIPSGIVRKFILKYRTKFDDPMALMRFLDGYQDGYCTQLYERLRRGVIDAEVWKMHIHQRIDEVIKKHKGLQKDLAKKTVKYTVGKKTYDIPLNQAMYLYMTMKREDALMAHAKSGFEYRDKNGKYHRVDGCATSLAITEEYQARPLVAYARNKLYEKFNDAEREYISLIEQIFNEDCKKAKSETDLKRDGYSHVKEGYYCPISINDAAHSIDGSNMFTQLNSDLGAFSFNKETVKGQKHELKLQPLTEVFDRHVNQVAVYSNIALTADSFSRILNLDISGNGNKSVSVKNAIKNTWDGTEKYIRDILAGIKGKPSDTPKWLKQLRSNYAKFALGGNLKVPVTQLSSLFASINILDIGCITKGIAVADKGDVDKYCSLAALRNYDNSAAMAQAVIDRSASVSGKIDKVGDVLMKHIGFADRFVVKWLWGSCQLQVEKNGGGKLGTENNKVEAGKLLEKVLLETQQNSLLTERSAGMRGHFIYQTVTMFSADAMKVIGRVYDAFGMARFTKYRLQNARNRNASEAEIAKLEDELKKARGMEARSVTALVSTSVMMYLIGLLFKAMYNNFDEEYEEKDAVGIAKDAFSQTLGNMLGGLPIIRDIATKLMDGYDIDNYAYSAVNDLIDSFTNLYDSIADGDERNLGNRLKNISYAVGQILGVPVRNVYNTLYGVTKRFSPGSAYKWDNMLEAHSYSADLKKAIEKDDEDMIETIVGLMLDESMGGVTDKALRTQITDLSGEGYSVLPRSVGDTVTYDGEEIKLTKKQQKRFKELYAVGHESAAELVKLQLYRKADDEAKARAINFIYNTYYNLALQEALGVDLEGKNVLFAEALDIEQLAIIYAIASGIEADKDRKGNAIAGSRKAKIEKYVESLRMSAAEKYLIMGYLGYKCKNGEAQVKAYVNRLRLSKDERARLMEYCGYAA